MYILSLLTINTSPLCANQNQVFSSESSRKRLAAELRLGSLGELKCCHRHSSHKNGEGKEGMGKGREWVGEGKGKDKEGRWILEGMDGNEGKGGEGYGRK